jgi:quinol monooxygenase YgiN
MAGRQVTVFALVKAKSGMEETVKKELSALVAPTLAEEGCINYDLHQSLDHAGHFRFYENWTSKELLDRHLQSAHVKRFIAKADQLLAEPPEITLWERLP